ncbi:hypothetical protein DPMN_123040 [Dreissena polymorpha]|uniref:Uncharacterized protein n=1 Tax=Dreissena polymorpha TaxID=45954 RepID=A0A9D4GQU8_DREPO|nr:hypothetical protein DPMN_123040 [Dreissena polymorpha]
MINIPMKFHDPRQNCPPPSSHVIQLTGTIFELNSHIKEKCPAHWRPCFFTNLDHFQTRPRYKQKHNVLTNFHDDWAKIVTSTLFTRENCHYNHIEKNAPPPTGGNTSIELMAKIVTSRVFTRFLYSQIKKTAPPTGGHVFQRIGTTFALNQDIIKTNILTNDLVLTRHNPISKLGRDLIGTKLLTKFHEDGTRNVASRVFTSKC